MCHVVMGNNTNKYFLTMPGVSDKTGLVYNCYTQLNSLVTPYKMSTFIKCKCVINLMKGPKINL